MPVTNKKIEQYLIVTHTILTNVRKDPETKERIKKQGFGDGVLGAGMKLLEEAESLYSGLLTTHAEQLKASSELQQEFDRLAKEFNLTRQILSCLLHDYPALILELGLNFQRKRTISGFIPQSINLYTNVKNKPHILEKVSLFDITPERMQAKLDSIEHLEDTSKRHSRLKGKCQSLCQKRDNKLAELKRFMKTLKTVLRFVFPANERQKLERLGISVRSTPKKKENVPGNAASEIQSHREQLRGTEDIPENTEMDLRHSVNHMDHRVSIPATLKTGIKERMKKKKNRKKSKKKSGRRKKKPDG